MTDKELVAGIEKLREQGNEYLQLLNVRANEIVEEVLRDVALLIEENGRKVCPQCGSYGKVERLDSGIMKRFGLRDWNGCPGCGGDNDKEGLGFIPAG